LAWFRDSRAGVPGKIGIWMWAPWKVTKYTIRGKWLASPRGGRCWLPHQGSEVVAYSRARSVCVFKVSPSSPVACPNTKKVPWWVVKGKVMVSPRSGPWLFLAPKVLQLWTNHLEWFMEGPCEWVKLIHSS